MVKGIQLIRRGRTIIKTTVATSGLLTLVSWHVNALSLAFFKNDLQEGITSGLILKNKTRLIPSVKSSSTVLMYWLKIHLLINNSHHSDNNSQVVVRDLVVESH